MLKHLQSPEGRLFNEWIIDILRREEKNLHNEDEPREVYRAQGSTRVLNIILNIEAELKAYQRDVDAGKVRKIGDNPNAVVQG